MLSNILWNHIVLKNSLQQHYLSETYFKGLHPGQFKEVETSALGLGKDSSPRNLKLKEACMEGSEMEVLKSEHSVWFS